MKSVRIPCVSACALVVAMPAFAQPQLQGEGPIAATVTVAGSVQQLGRARIARLSATYETTRRRHESFGLAIGGVLGAWIWNRQCGRPHDNCQEETGLYFGAPMLASGAIAHVLPARPAWRDLYRRT